MAEQEFYGSVKQSDVDSLVTVLAGKANDAEVVKNTGTQELSNSFIFNSAVGVAQGTVAYHAARRDDARFVPPGGTAGQVLTKNSGASNDMAWATVAGGDSLGGIVDCSEMTTAAAINTAASAAGPGYIIWLGARPSAAPLELEDSLILYPGQKLMGAGGRSMLTRVVTGASFPMNKPMVAPAGWLNDGTVADNPVSVVGIHFDGGAIAGVNGLTVYNFWSHFEDLQFVDFAAGTRQINVTDRSFNDVQSTNSHSENTFFRCRFDQTGGTHFYAESTNGISNQDGHLLDCFFVGCDEYSVRVTRAAGWSIENCHFYGIGWTAIALSNCYATKVLRNYIEDFGQNETTAAPTLGYFSAIEFATILDSRASIIADNTVSIIQPANTISNRYTGIYARAGAGQLNAHLVMANNVVVMAAASQPAGSNKSWAYRLGEFGDADRMLYVTAEGNAHDYNRASWYAGVELISAGVTMHRGVRLDPTTGKIKLADLPKLLHGQGTVTVTGGQTVNINASAESYPMAYRVTMTTATTANTIAVPAGTAVNGQVIKFHAYASGGSRTIAFASGYRLSSGITSRSFTVASGQVLIAAVEYDDQLAAWVITAATVSS